ncbi:MAG TPA: hypothetical protein VHS78_13200 [Candidatus Elarobacter sp.]|jgi:hypothetical protein|nr:hypothetical protein [Candidatus Elarobacter sp.]
MTPRTFDAPASATRRVSFRPDRAARIDRAAWLLERLIRREPLHYAAYERRFGRSTSSFENDLATVRAARIYRGYTVLGS